MGRTGKTAYQRRDLDIYNLRRTRAYREHHVHDARRGGEHRRAPQARSGRPPRLPASLHQGDTDSGKGLYHINAVERPCISFPFSSAAFTPRSQHRQRLGGGQERRGGAQAYRRRRARRKVAMFLRGRFHPASRRKWTRSRRGSTARSCSCPLTVNLMVFSIRVSPNAPINNEPSGTDRSRVSDRLREPYRAREKTNTTLPEHGIQ